MTLWWKNRQGTALIAVCAAELIAAWAFGGNIVEVPRLFGPVQVLAPLVLLFSIIPTLAVGYSLSQQTRQWEFHGVREVWKADLCLACTPVPAGLLYLVSANDASLMRNGLAFTGALLLSSVFLADAYAPIVPTAWFFAACGFGGVPGAVSTFAFVIATPPPQPSW